MSGKRIGYIRICGKNKNKQLQTVALDIIFTDTDHGKNSEQPQLAAAIHSATVGDQVFIDSMDRLGSSKIDALRNASEFTSKGASVTFLKEDLVLNQHEEPISMLIKTLLFEFNPVKPLATKKVSGPEVTAKKTRKPSKVTLTPKQIAELKRRANAGENKTALAKHFSVSRASLLAYLR